MEVELELVNVINAPGFSITCLDTWRSKLIIGTRKHGIVVYDIIYSPGQGKVTTMNSMHKGIGYGKPVIQLNAIAADGCNMLLVLSGWGISVYDINDGQCMDLTLNSSMNVSGVENYSWCTNGSRLCLATPTHFYIYKYDRYSFSQETNINFSHQTMGILLASSMLFVVYKRSAYSYMCGCFNIETKDFVADIRTTESPPVLKRFGSDRVLLHHDNTSTIFAINGTYKMLQWIIYPKTIAVMRNHCIGISDDAVEVLSFDAGGLLQSVQTKTPLKYITDQKDIFIASNDSVWHLVAPFPMDPLPLSKTSVPRGRTKRTPDQVLQPSVPSPTSSWSSAPSSFATDAQPFQSWIPPVTISPDASLKVLGLSTKEREYLQQLHIATVRQLAQNPLVMNSISAYKERIQAARMRAVDIVTLHESKTGELNVHQIKPEDSLQAIGMNEQHIVLMAGNMVFTVRQFAMMAEADVGKEVMEMHRKAAQVVRAHTQKGATQANIENVCGYMYLTDAEFAHLVEGRTLKSAYTLFQEYMECEPDKRIRHPWREVYYRYYVEAMSSAGLVNGISDADVFSYLCWRYKSIDHLDNTAATRAILFHLREAPPGLLQSTPLYNNPVRLNLTSLCRNSGHLYVQKITGEDTWRALSLVEYEEYIRKLTRGFSGLWAPLDLPQGCVVLPSGTIEECDLSYE